MPPLRAAAHEAIARIAAERSRPACEDVDVARLWELIGAVETILLVAVSGSDAREADTGRWKAENLAIIASAGGIGTPNVDRMIFDVIRRAGEAALSETGIGLLADALRADIAPPPRASQLTGAASLGLGKGKEEKRQGDMEARRQRDTGCASRDSRFKGGFAASRP